MKKKTLFRQLGLEFQPDLKGLVMIKNIFYIICASILLGSCQAMKKLQDGIYIQQRTSANKPYPRVDSMLIVANGNSATQRIMEDIIPLFSESLRKRGIKTRLQFISYADWRINEADFDNRNYAYTLWIYEQDRKMQKLEQFDYLVPIAMKLTDNRSSENVWIATSIINDVVKKQFYKEKYAGTLLLIFRANGIIN